MDSGVILFPEYEKLKKEVEQLRTELSMLLLERDELRYVICANIKMAYMLALGALEYKAFELECTYLRLKRKLEMIQARINRQERINTADIERVLDEEFEAYQRMLDDQIKQMNAAIERSKSKCLTDEERKELKTLYRKIVKILHPDLNPDINDEKIHLFQNAVEAYKSGDLRTIRIIIEMVETHKPMDDHQEAMSVLLKEKEKLENILCEIQESIGRIKHEFPYTAKELMEQPDEIGKRRRQIERMIKDYQEVIEAYRRRIKEMVEVSG